jgi:hypothetical protein
MSKTYFYILFKSLYLKLISYLYGIFNFKSDFYHSTLYSAASRTKMPSSSIGNKHNLLSNKTFIRKNITQILLYFIGFLSSIYLYNIYFEPQSLAKYITSIIFPLQVKSIQNISSSIIFILIILLLTYLWSIITQRLKFFLYSISLILFIIALIMYILLLSIEFENNGILNALQYLKIETIKEMFNPYMTKYYPAIVDNYPETLRPLYAHVISQFASHQWEITTTLEIFELINKEVQMYLDLYFEITLDENFIQHATEKTFIEEMNYKDELIKYFIFLVYVGYMLSIASW